MKKAFILLLLVISLLIVTPKTYAYVPPVSDNYLLNQGLGRTIDIATSRYAHPSSIIIGSNVLNPNYLDGLSLDRIEYNGDFTYDYQVGTSFNSYYSQKKLNYEQSASFSSGNILFNGTISSSFQNAIANSEYQRIGQYYSTSSLVTKTVKAALPNYLDNIIQYRGNINSTFAYNCSRLNSGQITYEQFTQMYGTHLIASATFGGKVNLNYSVTDSINFISSSKATAVQNKINLKIIGFNSLSSNFQSNVLVSDFTEILSNNVSIGFYADSIGGYGFPATSIQGNLTSQLQTWINSVHNYPSLIEYNVNGLVPLWELVPTVYTNAISILQNSLETYIQSVNNNLNYTNSISIDNQVIRSGEKTITDDGRFNNHYDPVLLSSSGYMVSNLIQKGLTHAHVVIEIDVKEVNDGYQYIFLYDNFLTTGNELGSYQFEHGPGTKKTTYNLPEEPYTFVFTVSLANLTNSFVIRYGASGNNDDDWKNKNIRVSYMFY
jgi:hypothetical protein